MAEANIQVWDLWFPDAAAQGLPFARGRLNATRQMLVHAAPETLRVEVRDDAGTLLASGDGLARTQESPIARLVVEGDRVRREDCWPIEIDHGLPVILPGGEVGILVRWWNSPARDEWRWSVEFYNHR
jgi:hypothetical protein